MSKVALKLVPLINTLEELCSHWCCRSWLLCAECKAARNSPKAASRAGRDSSRFFFVRAIGTRSVRIMTVFVGNDIYDSPRQLRHRLRRHRQIVYAISVISDIVYGSNDSVMTGYQLDARWHDK
jgi:hypothetical protein